VSDLLAIGEPLVELNQPKDGAPFVQGFGGDTSNAMIAAARLGADAAARALAGRVARSGIANTPAPISSAGTRATDHGSRLKTIPGLGKINLSV